MALSTDRSLDCSPATWDDGEGLPEEEELEVLRVEDDEEPVVMDVVSPPHLWRSW